MSWPDQARTYRLGLAELRQLEEKTGRGPFEVMVALSNGRWKIDDIFHTVRLGCIGAGMRQDDALHFAELHIRPGVLAETAVYARIIIHSAISGAPDEEIEGPKKKRRDLAAEKPAPAAAGSDGKRSTRRRRSSAGPRSKSSS